MSAYAQLRPDGTPCGFWPSALYPDPAPGQRHPDVPAEAVAVTEEQFQDCLANQGFRAWNGAAFVPYEPLAPPPAVPDRASRLGLKRALDETGEWSAVKAAIAADPALQEEWDLATEIRRADPLVQAMIAARGYASRQVDTLLIRAAALVR